MTLSSPLLRAMHVLRPPPPPGRVGPAPSLLASHECTLHLNILHRISEPQTKTVVNTTI